MSKTISSLGENTWKLFSLNGQQISVSDSNKIPFLSFDPQTMKVSGNTGCNSMSGSFSSEKDKLSFGQMATTRMFCEGDMESKFLSAVNNTSKFSMYNNQLVLNDSTGKQLAVFSPVKKE